MTYHTHHPACCSHRDETGAVLDCRCDDLNEREPVCETCTLEPTFRGWDQCLKCGIATSLADDPDYIRWAEQFYADEPEHLALIRAEWDRQSIALANAPYIRLTIKQAG